MVFAPPRHWTTTFLAATVALVLGAIPAVAASVVATVLDETGRPLADAVVTIVARAGTVVPADPNRLARAEVDQKNETFVPSVVPLRPGGQVVFHNSDSIRHHVYSFSPLHPFEMVQAAGEMSSPMLFDKPGVVAIGCNIHDQMAAYVYVTEAPFAAATDSAGKAVIADVPVGNFVATFWHPRLRAGTVPPERAFEIGASDSSFSVTLSVAPARRARPRDY